MKEYHQQPFPHWVFSEEFPLEVCKAMFNKVPGPQWDGWEARYNNDCERGKRTCRNVGIMPATIGSNLLLLNALTPFVEATTGIVGLEPDPTLHGGGLHVTEPGGWLSPHLDYAIHPKIPNRERRVNLILFFNPEWKEEWGGALELYADDGATVVERIYPDAGKMVMWLPSDIGYHGTQRTTPDAPPRCSLACYFLAPARPEATRKRALFVPNRGMK